MSKERFDNLLAMVGEHCSTLFNSVYCQQCVLYVFSIIIIFNIKVGPLISHQHYSSTVLTLRFLCTSNSQV